MYFVTVLYGLIEEKHFNFENNEDLPHRRTIGWFADLDKAKECVKRNGFSIYQSMDYEPTKYIIIEFVPEGTLPIGELKAWFAFNYHEETWYEIEQPKNAYTKMNYSIG